MNYYMVWSMLKNRDQFGNDLIGWNLIGVFKAADAESACRAAAKKSRTMGTFFAAEGFPWGIDLMDIEASEFGVESKLAELEERNRQLESGLTKLQQAEIRSREMEREAGIGDVEKPA